MLQTIKELWLVWVAFLLVCTMFFTLMWFQGHAGQKVLAKHGYELTWFEATFIDAEELCGNQQLDVEVQPKR